MTATRRNKQKHIISSTATMKEQQETLKKELGIMDVAINVVNITVGGGIFLLPALIAVILGNSSIIAYLVCGCMFLLVALCYAEVSSRITESGGSYIYLEKAFGPYVGFLANQAFWFAYGTVIAAALLNGAGDLLSVPFPAFSTLPYRALLFLLILAAFAYINIRGIKQGMIAVKTFTAIKLVPLVGIVVLGIFAINPDNISWPEWPSFARLGEASLVLFFAFAGGETALNISGEMKNPSRTGPLGLMLGVGSLVVFFGLIHLVAQGVLGADLINHTKAPLAQVANVLVGPWGFTFVVSCAVISVTGSLNSVVMVFPRVMYAGANKKMLPKLLSRIHPRFNTPYLAIIWFCIVAFTISISGGFKQLIILATITMLLTFFGVALAAIKFRLKPSAEFKASFLIPGGLTVPVLTIILIFWYLYQSKPVEIVGISIFTAVVTLIYLVRKFNV